jgi:uncharacterized protein (DUF885 family)
MPEITDAQKAEYDRALAALNQMWAHPEHGLAVKKAYKALYPTASIPEVDAPEIVLKPALEEVAAVKTAVTSLTERLDAMQVDRTNERESATLASSIDAAVKRYNFTPEGKATLIEQMKERQNPDAMSVAAWIASEIPRPAPATSSSFAPQSFTAAGLEAEVAEESMKALDANPVKWFDQQVAGMLSDPEFQSLAG